MREKIWKYKYKAHKDVYMLKTDFRCSYYHLKSHPELETFMDFKTWLTMYNADVSNWWMIDDDFRNTGIPYLIPYYHEIDGKCHFIKFTNAREYRKFKRWLRQHEKELDDYQNIKEQTELATIIRKKATEKVQQAQKELEKNEQNMKEILARISDEETPAWVKAVQYTQERLDNAVAYDSKGRRIYFEQRG